MYLDARGLCALWREGLLAKQVLAGRTRGYRHHPQLARFRAHGWPRSAINAYLAVIHAEARARGYAFDARKVGPRRAIRPMTATSAQVAYEWAHFLRKLRRRDPELCRRLRDVRMPRCHPLFTRVRGPLEAWERRRRR